jgi:hypothetical protein
VCFILGGPCRGIYIVHVLKAAGDNFIMKNLDMIYVPKNLLSMQLWKSFTRTLLEWQKFSSFLPYEQGRDGRFKTAAAINSNRDGNELSRARRGLVQLRGELGSARLCCSLTERIGSVTARETHTKSCLEYKLYIFYYI